MGRPRPAARPVTDPAGLTTSAVYDYRVFKPAQITDPNGNITSIGYTPLGLPAQIARLGKDDGTEGDTDSEPGQRSAMTSPPTTSRSPPIRPTRSR